MAEYNLAERAYKIADGSIGLWLTPLFAAGVFALTKTEENDNDKELRYSPLAQTAVATACFDAICVLKIYEGVTGHRSNIRAQ